MAPQPRTANGSAPLFGSGDWRDPDKLSRMSISELVSVLRDSFRKSDFDRVEETLLAKEAKLKAEIEKQKKDFRLLEEKFQLERLDKIKFEVELKMRERAKVVNGSGFYGNNVKSEFGFGSGKLDGLKKEKVGDGVAGAGAGVKEEIVELLAEKKKTWEAEPSRKNGLGASGTGKLAMGTVIDIEDSDEEMHDSHATLNGKETTSCIIADNKHQVSSGAVQKNLATRLDNSIGTLKRGFFTSVEFNTNILDGLDSDSSSSCSSSSSGSLDIDNLPLSSVTSNKKMRTMQSLLDN